MEVDEPCRRWGYGSCLIHERMRFCYEMRWIAAARRNVANTASRAKLQQAGLLPCARFRSGVFPEKLEEDPTFD
jgi:hypothetical protein